jgi:hypothetical protein
MIIISIGWPDPGLELVYLVVGVPILVLNAWEFFQPEVIDYYFGKPKIQVNKFSVAKEKVLMRNKVTIVLIIVSSAFILLIAGYSYLRSSVDHVTFLFALYTLLVKLASKLWHFLTEPVIFIAVLIFILLWLFRKPIIMLFPEIKGVKGIKFTDNFSQPVITPVPEELSPTRKRSSGKGSAPETNPAIAWFREHGAYIKLIQLMVDLDGKEVTKSEVLSKIEELGLISEMIPSNAHQILKDTFYRGAFESLYDYIFPIFCSIERKNKDTVAGIALRPGVRESLVEVGKAPGGSVQLEAAPPE